MPKSSEDRAKTRYGDDDEEDDSKALGKSIKETGPQSAQSLLGALKYIVSGPSAEAKKKRAKDNEDLSRALKRPMIEKKDKDED